MGGGRSADWAQKVGRRAAGVLVMVTWPLWFAHCALDFREAVPCEDSTQCPSGFSCDLNAGECVEGSGGNNGVSLDAGDTSQDGGTDASTNNGATSTNNSTSTSTNNGTTSTNNSTSTSTNNGTTPTNNGTVNTNNQTGPCPDSMVHITDAPDLGAFCIDPYEASRQDATADSAGIDNSRAISQPGVLPWTSITPTLARTACELSGKRLCTAQEWAIGCGGPELQSYPYSPSMFVQGDCNASGSVSPTGSFDLCVYEPYDTWDMSGNVAELIESEGGGVVVLGGSYADTGSVLLSCTAEPRSVSPSARVGFRCCDDALE